MDPAKTPVTPAAMSLALVVMVELGAKSLPFSAISSTGIARMAQIFIIFWAYHRSAIGIAGLGLAPGRIKHGFIRGILWSVIFGIITGCLGMALMTIGVNPLRLIHMSMPTATERIVIFYIVGGLVGPIAEEMLFRGMIYGYLRDQFSVRHATVGIIIAMTVSTSLFVLAHTENSIIPLPQLVGGIVFCLAYEKEKSLLTPMVIHCSGNMAIFTLSLI